MNSASDKELLALLRSKSYTPPVRLTLDLFRLFLDPSLDSAHRESIKKGISLLGASGWNEGALLLPMQKGSAAVSLLRLLGDLSHQSQGPCQKEFFLKYALHEQPQLARAALIALGKLSDPSIEKDVLPLWETPYEKPERNVLIETLGKVGGEASLSILQAFSENDHSLDLFQKKILSQACLRLKRKLQRMKGTGRILADVSLPEGTHVVLRCRAGLEPLLCQELSIRHKGCQVKSLGPGRVMVLSPSSLSMLFQNRLFIDCAFSIDVPNPCTEDALVNAMTDPVMFGLFKLLTDGPIRYRIQFEQGGHHRDFIFHVSQKILEKQPSLINDPIDSLWEIQIKNEKFSSRIDVVPKGFLDPRFSYCTQKVPASSHPTIAAALAFVASPKKTDVVWDPFVGAGTELVETSILSSCQKLMGTDLEKDAVQAAQTNLAQAGVVASILQADATKHHPKDVTLILTNPPMGRRVARGQIKQLLPYFLQHAASVLKQNGRLVWVSPLPLLHRKQMESLGFQCQRMYPVDMNGFDGEIQSFVKIK